MKICTSLEIFWEFIELFTALVTGYKNTHEVSSARDKVCKWLKVGHSVQMQRLSVVDRTTLAHI